MNVSVEMFTYANALGEEKRARADRRHRDRDRQRRGRRRAARPRWSSTCSSCCSPSPATRRRATRSPTGCSRSSSTPTSGSGCATHPRAVSTRGRGDRALGEPGDLLPALGDARHRAARPAAEGGRQDHGLVPVGEPRRRRVRAPVRLRRRPRSQPAPRLRRPRPALLPRLATSPGSRSRRSSTS